MGKLSERSLEFCLFLFPTIEETCILKFPSKILTGNRSNPNTIILQYYNRYNFLLSINLPQTALLNTSIYSTLVPYTLLYNYGRVCGILGKLTLLFALTLKAPESQHGLCGGFHLQKRTNYSDLKA